MSSLLTSMPTDIVCRVITTATNTVYDRRENTNIETKEKLLQVEKVSVFF